VPCAGKIGLEDGFGGSDLEIRRFKEEGGRFRVQECEWN